MPSSPGDSVVADDPGRVPGATLEEYELLLNARRHHLVPVDQPVVLITQAPRSGGTLLLRLLDGHPDLHVVPWELRFDLKNPLVRDPVLAWETLHDPALEKAYVQGFRQSHRDLHGDETVYPLLLPPSLHRALFEQVVESLEEPSERELRNAYLTALFNAWLDNQNLYSRTPKQWVVFLVPRLIAREQKLANFERVYPDGRVISVVRDPLSWFASARRWSRWMEWSRLEEAMDAWTAAAEAAIARKEAAPKSTLVIAFEDLLTDTRPTMRLVGNFLGVHPSRSTNSPTLNSRAIRANSSFKAPSAGISTTPLRRHEKALTKGESAYLRDRGWALYEQARAVAARP